MGRRIRVVVRTRPGEGGASCVRAESASRGVGAVVTVSDPSGAPAVGLSRDFCVDSVVSAAATNAEVFERLVHERIRSAAGAPDTSCFLAYGHTSSGKTHAIAGGGAEPGLLALAAEAVLAAHGAAEVAMLEVYGEAVHDLLARGERRGVRRRSGADGPVITVEQLTTCAISTVEEWEAVAEYGMQTRRTAPTERNARSSRSHAIFTIKSRGFRLCMVDLAGSERQTVFSPQLNRESIGINKSLSRLSTVLEALSTARRRPDGTSSYVNFRDTTLTVLLQRYLSGASMTTFLACIHPDAQFYQETLSTLRYTQRLKRIHTKAAPRQPSEDMSLFRPAEHQDLLAELVRLRRIVDQQQKQEGVPRAPHLSSPPLCSSTSPSAHLCENGNGDGEAEDDEAAQAKSARRHCGDSSLMSPPLDAALAHRQRQRLLRSKDTKRVAGWLLSRILGELSELSVGFDDYFDAFLPPAVQVVGYVSLMAHLPPRSDDEAAARLALLDVGDIAMGLSMLDAGIPACVGLHRLQCRASDAWEAHEYDEANRVFVLGVFEVGDELVEPMDESPDAFACCGGLLALEPLVPLAVVLCTPHDAADALKESTLRQLVTLQGQQDEAFETMAESFTASGLLNPAEEEEEDEQEDGDAADDDEYDDYENEGIQQKEEEEEDGTEDESELAQEIERQAQNKVLICSPFLDSPSSDAREPLSHNNFCRFTISSSFSDSTGSSESVLESPPQTKRGNGETTTVQRCHRNSLTNSVGSLRTPGDNRQCSEDIDKPEHITLCVDRKEDKGHGESASHNKSTVHNGRNNMAGIQNGRMYDKAAPGSIEGAHLGGRVRFKSPSVSNSNDGRISTSKRPSVVTPQQQQKKLPERDSHDLARSARSSVEEQKGPRVRKSRRSKSKKRLVMAKGCQSCTMI